MILEKIKKPNDIHKVSLEDFPRLAYFLPEKAHLPLSV